MSITPTTSSSESPFMVRVAVGGTSYAYMTEEESFRDRFKIDEKAHTITAKRSTTIKLILLTGALIQPRKERSALTIKLLFSKAGEKLTNVFINEFKVLKTK
jgi:hypothetical protein